MDNSRFFIRKIKERNEQGNGRESSFFYIIRTIKTMIPLFHKEMTSVRTSRLVESEQMRTTDEKRKEKGQEGIVLLFSFQLSISIK